MKTGRGREYTYFAADFETTVYDGQTSTEIWAAACCELNTEDVHIFGCFDDFFKFLKKQNKNLIVEFHNLKFDGSFILWQFEYVYKIPLACWYSKPGETIETDPYAYRDINMTKPNRMENGTYNYAISDMGQWYQITYKYRDNLIIFRDSLKLLPFRLAKIGHDFKTKHQKLTMEYKGFRYAGCYISEAEKQYIANDVLVLKEALEIMFSEGHTKMTIGSCAMDEYRRTVDKSTYFNRYPNLYNIAIDPERHQALNAGEWIHHSYHGGWCYLVPEKANAIHAAGITADVNSLYPSMMHSESGNKYPVGMPHFWTGNFIPDEALQDDKYYFVRIKTRFYIKPGKLPTIQIKGSMLYRHTEWLTSSDIVRHSTGERSATYLGLDGIIHDTRVVLTMTMTDYVLFREQYDVVDFEILDGCYFNAETGIFDAYIDKYKKIKMEAKGAKRAIAKLFLNSLYGKMAANKNSSFKLALKNEDETIDFVNVEAYDKTPGYIAVGSAITSYARNFTIRAAQANYYGPDQPGFIYADTDSIHCDLPADALKNVPVHPNAFCHWKLEASWDKAIFVRQKTYIEHVTAEDLQLIEKPYNNVKCAGMPDRCKLLLEQSMDGYVSDSDLEAADIDRESFDKLCAAHADFVAVRREYKDFKPGLRIPGKLVPVQIPGGCLLTEVDFTINR